MLVEDSKKMFSRFQFEVWGKVRGAKIIFDFFREKKYRD